MLPPWSEETRRSCLDTPGPPGPGPLDWKLFSVKGRVQTHAQGTEARGALFRGA